MESTRVESLGELIEAVTPERPEPESGRRRNYVVYRGMADASAPLLTSLDRLGGPDAPHGKAHLEEHILRNFLRYSKPYVSADQDEWELLFIAQHHGLPTRLLDWTYSPLVAAHFATLDPRPRGDRIVWQLDWRRMHQSFGLKPLAFLVQDLIGELERRGIGSRGEFFARAADSAPFACMLEPPAMDHRITVQSAAFTICSDTGRPFDAFLAEHGVGEALRQIVIPAAAVALIRDQLDICAIDERRLFPDLDGVAREVARYYASSAAGRALPDAAAPLRRGASGP
ncbi:MAG TPA: FRG domain-containing protein [Gemmatimonadales bacterium]|nr:FRG domain-containing protein [Gemmatimonadales bacterium]